MNKHKWNGKIKHKCVDGGVVACLKCNCIKQYVAGRVTYFINDNVYHKAPKCLKEETT